MAESGEKLTAKVTIEIKAPVHKVWEALTRPDLIRRYLFGAEVRTDWKVGSPIIYRGVTEGDKFEDKGVILSLEQNKFLQITQWSNMSGLPDEEENYTKITYTLSFAEGITSLSVIQDNLPSDKMRIYLEHNWKLALNKMKRLLERR